MNCCPSVSLHLCCLLFPVFLSSPATRDPPNGKTHDPRKAPIGFFGAITASARSVWLVWKLRRAVIAWVSEVVVARRERARMVNGILEAMIGDGCLLAWIV